METTVALAAVGATPSSSRTSSVSRNGLPPVTRAQAVTNFAAGLPPSCSATCGRSPSLLSGLGSRTVSEVASKRFGPGGDHECEREPVEVGEEAQRGDVGPVRVVDQQDQRSPGREVRGQPVEAVQHRGLRLGRRGPEHRLSERRGAAEVELGGLEQLTHDPEREVALELAGASAEHETRRERARVGEQRGLADPRRPVDQQARAGRRDGPLDRRQLPLTFLEHSTRA